MATPPPKLKWIRKQLKDRGFLWFKTGAYNLNIVGVRSPEVGGDEFNDWLTVAYRTHTGWACHALKATLDPGTYYLQNPLNENGTAIICPGQYPKAYELGKHRGEYPALVQVGPVDFWRDNNKDLNRDYTNKQTGVIGLNIHKASAVKTSLDIARWSAGCTVVADPIDWTLFMSLVEKSAATWGTSFTYTVLEAEA